MNNIRHVMFVQWSIFHNSSIRFRQHLRYSLFCAKSAVKHEPILDSIFSHFQFLCYYSGGPCRFNWSSIQKVQLDGTVSSLQNWHMVFTCRYIYKTAVAWIANGYLWDLRRGLELMIGGPHWINVKRDSHQAAFIFIACNSKSNFDHSNTSTELK